MVVELVGERRRVLDIGCGFGAIARGLANRQCDIVGIDRDPRAVEEARKVCAHAFVADVDSVPIAEIAGDRTFDVVVLSDVLGHLREPLRVLDECRVLLDEGGALVASVANGAHGSVRLSVFSGSFSDPFEPSRVRLFNAKSLEELFLHAGFKIERMERATAPIDRANAPAQAIAEVEADPESETLWFVVRATPLSNEAKYRAISKRFLLVGSELAEARQTLANRDRELEAARAERPVSDDLRQRQLIDGLRRALDEAIVQHDAVATEAAKFRRQLADMTANRDEHIALGRKAVDQFTEAHDTLIVVKRERDELAARDGKIVRELERVRIVRDGLVRQRDAALADRSAEAVLEERIAAYAARLGELQVRDVANQAAIEALEAELATRDARVGELQDRNVAYARTIETLESEVFEAWHELERLEDEREQNRRLAADLRGHVARADAREAELCESLDDLRALADERTAETIRLAGQLTQRQRETRCALEELEVMQTRLVLQTDAFSESSAAESQRLATLIDDVQRGPYWSLKRLSDRFLGLFRR